MYQHSGWSQCLWNIGHTIAAFLFIVKQGLAVQHRGLCVQSILTVSTVIPTPCLSFKSYVINTQQFPHESISLWLFLSPFQMQTLVRLFQLVAAFSVVLYKLGKPSALPVFKSSRVDRNKWRVLTEGKWLGEWERRQCQWKRGHLGYRNAAHAHTVFLFHFISSSHWE